MIFPKILVASYLLAIVLANTLVSFYGQAALIIGGLVFIPFDLFSRDLLHEYWKNRVWVRMGLLIISGSILSVLLNLGSLRVALGSCLAFLLAGLIDTCVYTYLHRRPREVRMVVSNSVASVTDTLVFVGVVFWEFNATLCGLQIGAKILGGIFWVVLWSLVRRRFYNK